MHQQQTAFENIMGKEEIALNEQSCKQFLLFPQCFLLKSENCTPICQYLFAAELEEAKISM